VVLAQVPATELDDVAVNSVGSEVHTVPKGLLMQLEKTCTSIQ